MALFSTLNGILGAGNVPISFEFIDYDTAQIAVGNTTKDITLSSTLPSLSDAIAFINGHDPLATGNTDNGAIVTLTSATNVRLTRTFADVSASIRVGIVIMQFPTGSIRSKQNVTIVGQGAASISAVDTSKSIILPTGYNGTNTFNNIGSTAKFNSSTEIGNQASPSSGVNYGYLVVETN